MTVADQISFLVLLLFPITALVERFWPARRFPKIPWWHAIGFGLFAYVALLSLGIVTILPTGWLAAQPRTPAIATGPPPSSPTNAVVTPSSTHGSVSRR